VPRTRRNTTLVRFIDQHDVEAVLDQLPAAEKSRLGQVIFRSSAATRTLGYVTDRGRRDIVLASRLPPRVSLRGYMYAGHRAIDYGAPARGQWPPWAVRRYLLFGVLLHELGHLQQVSTNQPGALGGYASETKADEFSLRWRDALWAAGSPTPDPAHHPPCRGEIEFIGVWLTLAKPARRTLVDLVLAAPHREIPDLGFVDGMSREAAGFLRRALLHAG